MKTVFLPAGSESLFSEESYAEYAKDEESLLESCSGFPRIRPDDQDIFSLFLEQPPLPEDMLQTIREL